MNLWTIQKSKHSRVSARAGPPAHTHARTNWRNFLHYHCASTSTCHWKHLHSHLASKYKSLVCESGLFRNLKSPPPYHMIYNSVHVNFLSTWGRSGHSLRISCSEPNSAWWNLNSIHKTWFKTDIENIIGQFSPTFPSRVILNGGPWPPWPIPSWTLTGATVQGLRGNRFLA